MPSHLDPSFEPMALRRRFLAPKKLGIARALLQDGLQFLLFLVFLALVFTVGALCRLIDRILGSRLLDGLIRLFELCAGS